MTQETKTHIANTLMEQYTVQQPTLEAVETRLCEYYQMLVSDHDAHNAYELLGALKFLRLMDNYEHDLDTFQDVVYKYEGVWQCEEGIWRHVRGGLKHPGTAGPTYYRLQPFQVFVLANMFLLKAWVNTGNKVGSRPLLKTERVDEDGHIYDLRRLCTEFTLYTPRKVAKTQLSAFVQFFYFMSGDENAECYCCANASDQAKILFRRTTDLIRQVDPKEKRIRFTASQVNWKPGQFRSATLTALSAGGKAKDGLFAQLCSADEYGSAAYVNGRSDMGQLVSVVESSMGPRREPMTFISTTAGIITAGPFIDKLQGIRRLLELEMTDMQRELSSDRQMCLLLEPDEWEMTNEELLLTDKTIRKKINPMLGIIVQHSFYDDEIAKARQNPEKKNEVISKLFNVYNGVRVTHWIKSDKIRSLQIDRRVTDCKYADGWNTFGGFDFSLGDDLYANVYLSVDYKRSNTMRGRFFADCDCWVLEDTLMGSPNRLMYERWVSQGWLHVCKGEVFDATEAMDRVAEITAQGVNFLMFGYDPAQSVQPINRLKAWLQTIFQQRTDMGSKDMAEAVKRMVIPVSQGAMTQNPRIGELEHMILEQEPWLTFSANPIWPWAFGNTACEIGNSDLRRIVKGGPQATHKIDPVHGLLDAMFCFDLSEGRIDGV